MLENMSKFECPSESMSDPSNRNCFGGRSFSQMKLIKTRLRNRLGEINLSYLMKMAIESPQTLSEEELEQIVDV